MSDDCPITRSAQHWFLDAATYARDGDTKRARVAALSGLAALPQPAPRTITTADAIRMDQIDKWK